MYPFQFVHAKLILLYVSAFFFSCSVYVQTEADRGLL